MTGATRLQTLDLGLKDYTETLILQNRLVESVKKGGSEILLLVEHPSVFTIGGHGDEKNLLSRESPLVKTDRGGDITYHGPGQLLGYPIVNIKNIGMGTKDYVFFLEETLIVLLGKYGVGCGRFGKFIGVWVDKRKIASVGIRVEEGVTKHGFALNVNTDLSYFEKIIPCGLTLPMTSMEKELRKKLDFKKVKDDYAGIFLERWSG